MRIGRALCVLAAALALAPVSILQGADGDPHQTAAQVDRLLAKEVLADATVAPKASDQTLLRRIFLDLVGQAPSAEEVIAYSLDPDPQKQRKLVDRLLSDERFGANWAGYWRDVIMFRRSDDRAVLGSAALEADLKAKLNENRPWDAIARDFITAAGDVTSEGATAIIYAQMGQPEETVSEISRIFLGIQIQCAQCHDHPTDRWQREQFHQLAAFFPRVAVRPNRTAEGRIYFTVAASDFAPRFAGANNANRFRGTLEHRMPDLNDPSAPGKVMQPVFFVTGQKLPLGARDGQRRGALADWITAPDNPWFAKALVNRLWAELVGEGFYEPVDDLGPDRQCSAPETMEHLAQAFIASGYDLKWLYRTILATEAYARESRDRRAPDEPPFAANVAQRLRSDALYNNLIAALGTPAPGRQGPPGAGFGSFRGPQRLFAAVFGYDPSEPRDQVNATIPQALAMMNSPTVNAALSSRLFGPLGRLTARISSDEDLVVELYLRALSREPNDKELAVCLSHFDQARSRPEAAEDVMWSLLNSTEFLYRR